MKCNNVRKYQKLYSSIEGDEGGEENQSKCEVKWLSAVLRKCLVLNNINFNKLVITLIIILNSINGIYCQGELFFFL